MTTKKRPFKMIMERKGMFVCKMDGPKGVPTVLKIKFGSGAQLKNTVDREKIALYVLKGLAVPKLINIPKKEIAKLVSDEKFFHLAMEWIPGKGCFGRAFSVPQALALWLFTIEQMCAFRRKKVLYTDFKHNHLRITDDLSAAGIVDFDACLMVEDDGLYPTEYLGHTPELAAPEFHFSKEHTERVVTYQMGMFLGSLLLQYFHNSDVNALSLRKLKTILTKNHLKEIYSIFEKCIAPRPADRVKDLEVLFSQIEKVELPQETYEIWERLRAPYVKELAKLKFAESVLPKIKKTVRAA